MILGLPPIGFKGVCLEASDIPSGMEINITTPVHLFSISEKNINI